MGNFSSNTMDKTIKKNQEYISEMNKIKMDRWIQMHYQIKERERAMEIARNREIFYWLGSFYIVYLAGVFAKFVLIFQKTKRLNVLGSIVPLSFLVTYYTDLAYGSKVHRIISEADMIMQHEPELLEWPCGLPTVAGIDLARVNTEMDKKLHPSTST